MLRRTVFATALSLCSAVAVLGVSSASNAQVVLPFFEDWEATSGETYLSLTPTLNGAPEWSFEPALGEARLRLAAGAGFYASGTHAATMDRNNNTTGFATGYLTLTLDMTNYTLPNDNVVLDFKHMHHGEENHPDDRVWVRGSSLDTYVQIFDLFANQGTAGQYNMVEELDVSATLVGAAQQFSSTFQVRFGQHDDFSATAPNTTDGRSFDDIFVRRVLNNDMTIQSINLPADQACGNMAQDVEVLVLNAGAITQSNIPIMVDITGDFTTSFSTNIPGPVAKNQTAIINVGQLDTYVGGNINISATVMLANDDDTANDNTSVARVIKPVVVTAVTPPPVCTGQTAVIEVTPEPFTTFELYDVATGGMPLASGDMLTTPPVDQLTTFYVERSNAVILGGAADNSIGNGAQYGSFDNGLVFNVTTPIRLDAVHVYPAIVGTVSVQILNGSDVVVGSATYPVQAADVGNKTRVELGGITLPIGGGYKMVATGSSTPLYRNSDGAAYPYDIGGWASITGDNTVLTTSYYFFYDWEVSRDVPVCGTGDRTPVDVDVDLTLCSADLVVTLSGPDMAEPLEDVAYTVTVTNNGPNNAFNVDVGLPTPNGLTFTSNAGDCAIAYPCSFGDLLPSESRTVTSTYSVDAGFSGMAALTATGTTDTPEGMAGDETDTVQLNVSDPSGTGGGGGMSNGSGGATTTTTSGAGGQGGGGGDDPGDDGCSCRSARTPNSGGGWLLALAGAAIALLRRRPRDLR